MGCTMFIRGEVINSIKGIYLFGTHARLVSILWIIIAIGLGPYQFIKNKMRNSKAGGTLLLLGLLIGILTVGFIETHYSEGWPLLVGYLATLLLSIPGLIVGAIVAEANRQIQMNHNAEQGVAPYVAQSAPSGER